MSRPKRYLITESQFQSLLENRIEKKLMESVSFKTEEEKRAFLKPGNIITLKDKILELPQSQIAIGKIHRTKSGAVKITNPLGTESYLFASEEALVNAVDWDWMQQNII